MDRVLTAIERTALPKQMLYSDFVGGSMKAFILALEFAIVLPPRPVFVGGKGRPYEKEKGSLCEEES